MSTTVPISEMSAGRDMDRLVAERVMGWKLGEPEEIMGFLAHGSYMARLWKGPGIPREDKTLPGEDDWQPSTKIIAAWEVMEWLRERSIVVLRTVNNGWLCTTWTEVGQFRNVRHESHGDTAPEAICRCALEVVVGRE